MVKFGLTMKVIFADDKLALIRTEQAHETRLPISVIQSCRNKLVLLENAPDERTLRNWRSLHYEKLRGNRDGQRSIRLNDQWRLIFELDEIETPPIIKILSIEDYH